MTADRVVPLVLAGGAGTRLWPLSRAKMPKQFIKLLGDRSTYQQTLQRVSDRALFEPPVVVTNVDFQSIAIQQARDVGLDITVVLEPVRRDSCAAIVAGAWMAAERGPQTPVMALAADHVIAEDALFVDAVRRGLDAAKDGHIVAFGLKPTEPRTSFGYIRPGQPLGDGVALIAEFVEKPDAPTAARYIAEGMLWNGGNFLFRADVLAGEVKRLEPGIHDAVAAAVAKAERTGGVIRLDAAAFAEAGARSLDYAVMERTDRAAVVTAGYRCSDIGTWQAVLEAGGADPDGNRLIGEVEALDTRNSYVRSEERLTAVVGLSDVVVVTTPDAVLVTSRAAAQRVKDLVARLDKHRKRLVNEHVRSHRPWGWYQEIDRGERFRVKRLVVEPGGSLSLQRHLHRAEHWVVVRGIAEVTVDGRAVMVHENESIDIPLGAVHRLANPGHIGLEIIEVQTGSYLEEDDIIRLDDPHRRT